MRKKLIIFDLDGTLLNTSYDLADFMNAMLTHFGYPHITVEQAKRYIGNGARNFVLRSLPDSAKDRADECLAVYNGIYNASNSPKTALYDGMAEVLRFIKERGAFLAIASNKPQVSTDKVCERYLRTFGFDIVYGKREGFGHKPNKECGEYILRELNVSPEDALVIGDGETDVAFSKNLGCGCVAVTWGYRSREVLKDAGAEIFADSPEELKDIIGEFLNK